MSIGYGLGSWGLRYGVLDGYFTKQGYPKIFHKRKTDKMVEEIDNDAGMTNNLKNLREARKLTQKEVGKMLDLSTSAVCRHEVNSRGLTLPRVEAYANLYKVSAAEIFVTLPHDDLGLPRFDA